MKIPAKGKVWLVLQPERMLNATHRFLLGCERCMTTCSTNIPCKCCKVYGTRSAGGTKIYLPDDGKGHLQLMPLEELRAMAQSEVA